MLGVGSYKTAVLREKPLPKTLVDLLVLGEVPPLITHLPREAQSQSQSNGHNEVKLNQQKSKLEWRTPAGPKDPSEFRP